MSLTETENRDLLFAPPKFKCDTALKDVPEPLPQNVSFNMVLVGKPGSGKSSLATNIITNPLRKKYHSIFIVIPKNSMNSYACNPFQSIDEEQIFHDLTIDTLLEIYGRVSANAEEGLNSLLYIDDQAANLKKSNIQQTFKELLYNRRHLRLGIINSVQRLTTIPKSIRAVTQLLIIFKPCNKAEGNILFDEMINLEKKEFVKLMNYTFKKKHDHMLIVLHEDRYYRNFNKIEGLDLEIKY
jgi:excinuclease UvrABC ATPase subunit